MKSKIQISRLLLTSFFCCIILTQSFIHLASNYDFVNNWENEQEKLFGIPYVIAQNPNIMMSIEPAVVNPGESIEIFGVIENLGLALYATVEISIPNLGISRSIVTDEYGYCQTTIEIPSSASPGTYQVHLTANVFDPDIVDDVTVTDTLTFEVKAPPTAPPPTAPPPTAPPPTAPPPTAPPPITQISIMLDISPQVITVYDTVVISGWVISDQYLAPNANVEIYIDGLVGFAPYQTQTDASGVFGVQVTFAPDTHPGLYEVLANAYYEGSSASVGSHFTIEGAAENVWLTVETDRSIYSPYERVIITGSVGIDNQPISGINVLFQIWNPSTGDIIVYYDDLVATTDYNGQFRIEYDLKGFSDGEYQIIAVTLGEYAAETSTYFTVSHEVTIGQLFVTIKTSDDRTTYKIGEKIILEVEVDPSVDADIGLNITGPRTEIDRYFFTGEASAGKLFFEVPSNALEEVGKYKVVATAHYEGYGDGEAHLTFTIDYAPPAENTFDISIETDKSEYSLYEWVCYTIKVLSKVDAMPPFVVTVIDPEGEEFYEFPECVYKIETDTYVCEKECIIPDMEGEWMIEVVGILEGYDDAHASTTFEVVLGELEFYQIRAPNYVFLGEDFQVKGELVGSLWDYYRIDGPPDLIVKAEAQPPKGSPIVEEVPTYERANTYSDFIIEFTTLDKPPGKWIITLQAIGEDDEVLAETEIEVEVRGHIIFLKMEADKYTISGGDSVSISTTAYSSYSMDPLEDVEIKGQVRGVKEFTGITDKNGKFNFNFQAPLYTYRYTLGIYATGHKEGWSDGFNSFQILVKGKPNRYYAPMDARIDKTEVSRGEIVIVSGKVHWEEFFDKSAPTKGTKVYEEQRRAFIDGMKGISIDVVIGGVNKGTSKLDAEGKFSIPITISQETKTGMNGAGVDVIYQPNYWSWYWIDYGDIPNILVKPPEGAKLSVNIKIDDYYEANDKIDITGQVTASDGNVEDTTVEIIVTSPDGDWRRDASANFYKTGEYGWLFDLQSQYNRKVLNGEYKVEVRAWKHGYKDGHATKTFDVGKKIKLTFQDDIEAVAADGVSNATLTAIIMEGGKPFKEETYVQFGLKGKGEIIVPVVGKGVIVGYETYGITDGNGKIKALYKSRYGLSANAWRYGNRYGYPGFDNITITATAYDENKNEIAYGETNILVVPPPIILIHGVAADSSTWKQELSFEKRIRGRGFMVFLFEYDPNGDIAHSAEESLKEFIDKSIQECRKGEGYEIWLEDHFTEKVIKVSVAKVDIVAHSMGGLVSRWYTTATKEYSHTDEFGNTLYRPSSYRGDVRKLIMLGTPNHGSPTQWMAAQLGITDYETSLDLLKSFGLGKNAAPGPAWDQLEWKSDFLRELNDIRGINKDVEHLVIAGDDGLRLWAPLIAAGGLVGLGGVKVTASVYISFVRAWGKGDGVVPVWSASLKDLDSSIPLIVTSNHHNDMTTGMYCFNDVYSNLRYRIGTPTLSAKARCPVTLYCYDSSNELIPVNLKEDIDEDEPIAFYWEEEDEKSLLILNADEDSRILVEGEDVGKFNFTINRNFGEEYAYVNYENLTVIEGSMANIQISDQSDYLIEMDEDGDGSADQTISPEARETEFEIITEEPPLPDTTTETSGSILGFIMIITTIAVVVGLILFYKKRRSKKKVKPAIKKAKRIKKPTRYCMNCGASIPEDMKYCLKCGKEARKRKIAKTARKKPMSCSKCGKLLPLDSRFCEKCGTKIE